MELQRSRCFFKLAILVLVVLTVNGFSISESKTKPKQAELPSESENLRNGIVLIGLNEVAKGLSGYGVIPILEKDIINLFDANATLGDKIVGDSRKFGFHANNGDKAEKDSPDGAIAAALQSSRLLPLVTAPKKALLLFALHETFLKSNKGESNCVVLSKEDLEKLLAGTENMNARHTYSES